MKESESVVSHKNFFFCFRIEENEFMASPLINKFFKGETMFVPLKTVFLLPNRVAGI